MERERQQSVEFRRLIARRARLVRLARRFGKGERSREAVVSVV